MLSVRRRGDAGLGAGRVGRARAGADALGRVAGSAHGLGRGASARAAGLRKSVGECGNGLNSEEAGPR